MRKRGKYFEKALQINEIAQRIIEKRNIVYKGYISDSEQI
jgi:hypothetical protein